MGCFTNDASDERDEPNFKFVFADQNYKFPTNSEGRLTSLGKITRASIY